MNGHEPGSTTSLPGGPGAGDAVTLGQNGVLVESGTQLKEEMCYSNYNRCLLVLNYALL